MSQIVSNTWHPMTRFVPISMRYGQFRYYWLALLAGVTGHQMLLNFTMGWLLFDLTGQERDLAFLGIAIAVPALALNVVGGVLADRFEPKVLVAVAQSTSATVVVVLAVMVMLGRVEPAHVLIAAVLIGTVQAFDQPSRSSLFPRLVQREHIVNAVAMESLVWNGVRVLAPALAGIMIEQISIQASMFFSAATFYVLGSIVALLKLRDRAPATGQVTQQVMEGIRYVRTHTVFFLVMLLTFCNSLFGMAYVHLMPSFAKEVLGVEAGSVGYLLGASGLGAIIGTLIIARLKDHHPKGLIIIGRGDHLWCVSDPVFAGGVAGPLHGLRGDAADGRDFQLPLSHRGTQRPAAPRARPAARQGNGAVRHDVEPGPPGDGPGWICCPVHQRIGGGGGRRRGDYHSRRADPAIIAGDPGLAGRNIRIPKARLPVGRRTSRPIGVRLTG